MSPDPDRREATHPDSQGARIPQRPSSPGRSGFEILGLALALLVGSILRIDQIGAQIIAGDEWHALAYVAGHGYGSIFTHFGDNDHSIPLTLFYELVSETVGLDETWMRAPSLLFGIAAIVVVPLLARAFIGAKAGVVLAWLIATSPVHVFYSRFARPYSAVFFLCAVGAFAFLRWWGGGGRRWAWLYAVCAILAPWFHLALLAFSLAPLAWGAWGARGTTRRLGGPPDGDGARTSPGWRSLLLLGAGITAGLAVLLVPPLAADLGTVAGRSGQGLPGQLSFAVAYDLVSGTSEPLVGFAFGLSFLLGLVALAKGRRPLLLYLLFLVACQTLSLLVARPAVLDVELVLVRYEIPAVALALLVAAAGLEHFDRLLRKEWTWCPPHAASGLLCVCILAFGPVAPFFSPGNRVLYRPNSFTNHDLFQRQYSERDRRRFLAQGPGPKKIPAFYAAIRGDAAGADGGEGGLVEAPWFLDWVWSPFVVYQRIHGRPVLFGFVCRPGEPSREGELPWPDPRFRFRNFAHLDDEDGMRARGVRYVVLHKSLADEVIYSAGRPSPSMDAWIARYRERHGDPCYEDEDLCVFDLLGTPRAR